ncbi:hypothetical protein ANN_24412 [Periplaneta americana]|uniref:Uncharacterized protein n=1 Tax=Periplaneta americana TaxID=6978 RepID=A0ABQ8S3C9_PERAM|nr:hypothetical protein ANN_24412 [Periplaneta americana]
MVGLLIVLGSHTALEMVLLLLITVLELGYWNTLQLVGYGCLNVAQGSKTTSLEVCFQSREQEKSHGLKSGE